MSKTTAKLKSEVAPVRLQRRRTKGFKLVSPNGLPIKMVTRPGFWGNPFIGSHAVQLFNMLMRRKHGELQKKILEYGIVKDELGAILGIINMQCGWGHEHQQRIGELRGFNLACFCSLGKKCHADVLLKLANSPEKKKP